MDIVVTSKMHWIDILAQSSDQVESFHNIWQTWTIFKYSQAYSGIITEQDSQSNISWMIYQHIPVIISLYYWSLFAHRWNWIMWSITFLLSFSLSLLLLKASQETAYHFLTCGTVLISEVVARHNRSNCHYCFAVYLSKSSQKIPIILHIMWNHINSNDKSIIITLPSCNSFSFICMHPWCVLTFCHQ